MRNRGTLFVVLVVVLLVSTSPLAADPVIQRGIDAFTGRIAFKGLPLETAAPGQLRGRDTVIERLDDAVFNAKGTAATRIRFKALSLVSIAPLRTACGAYHVYVTLAGKQRVTTMSIHRTQAGGGTFVAPLAVDARLTFIPVKQANAKNPRKLELTGSFTFPAAALPWSLKGGESARQIDSAVVDTNGDLAPDTLLRGTPNFWPGWAPDGVKQQVGAICYFVCEPASCHEDPSTGKQHCTGPVCAGGGTQCP